MPRKIQAPGVEINEFDRSQYGNKPDYALPNAPVSLVTGFADKGPDYVLQWINSPTTLVETYGYPHNEAEKYFYNAQLEILNAGGYCIAAKLPYFNEAKDKYVYCSYTLDKKPKYFSNVIDQISGDNAYNYFIFKYLYDFLLLPNIDVSAFYEYALANEEKINDFIFLDPTITTAQAKETETFFKFEDSTYCLSNVNILDMFTRNNIGLSIIEDLILYVDDKCDFEYEAKRVYTELFYDPLSGINNNAAYLLSAIYDGATVDQLSLLNPNCVRYEKQIISMQNTIHSVEDMSDFETLMKRFAQDHSHEYFMDYFNRLSVATENADFSNYPIDEFVLKTCFNSFIELSAMSKEYLQIQQLDSSLKSYYEIHSNALSDCCKMSFSHFDDMTTGLIKPEDNQFYIVDITRSKYEKIDVISGDTRLTQKLFKDKDFLGIVPVVVTPMNALYFQELINVENENISSFNIVSSLQSVYTKSTTQFVVGRDLELEEQNYVEPLAGHDFVESSTSKTVASYFPRIVSRVNNYVDRQYLKHIGIVVLRAFKDTANNGKIGFSVLEAFEGSLDKNAQDEYTHENIYIGNRINQASKYIRFFSSIVIDDEKDEFDTYFIKNQTATSLGFYLSECEKDISFQESINKPLNIVLDHAQNSFGLPLDIIVDAGVSNIAQFIRSVYWKNGYGKYTFNDTQNLNSLKVVTQNNVSAWKTILQKFDNFCKQQRSNKDCMFIADGLRHFCLFGNQKRVRHTNIPASFMNDIFPGLKYMQALDSSYSAGYCNWYLAADDYTKDMFWLPPSIKAVGVYIYTDTYCHPWDAPAGIRRATLKNVYDVAFNPSIDEAGIIYNHQWNYAISYPIDGIVIEGQRTFQKDKTSLDRINVRRLLLYLEKNVARIGRHFLYEGNTEYLRQTFVDQITTIFEDCENGSGISDFAIKCDEENNTLETIENHELHVKIAVKPIKTLEFLVCDFVVTNQRANVNEEVLLA